MGGSVLDEEYDLNAAKMAVRVQDGSIGGAEIVLPPHLPDRGLMRSMVHVRPIVTHQTVWYERGSPAPQYRRGQRPLRPLRVKLAILHTILNPILVAFAVVPPYHIAKVSANIVRTLQTFAYRISFLVRYNHAEQI